MQRTEITSHDNQRLVNARKVRDGGTRELMFVEGKRLVEETLRSNVVIVECFVIDNFADDVLVTDIETRCNHIAIVSAKLFKTITDTETSQGIVLLAKRPAASGEFVFDDSTIPVSIYLHEINNPSNLGAVLRTAEAAGVKNALISKNSADAFSPKALRASMGSAFRLNISMNCEFEKVIKFAAKNNLLTTGADASVTTSYTDVDWKKTRMLVFGSEAHGLNPEHKKTLDELICIPMADGVESLNLAVSVGVILFEAKRQVGV